VVLLGIIPGHALLQMGSGRAQLAEMVQSIAQRSVGHYEECGVLEVLGQTEKLLSQLLCRLVLRSPIMKIPQPPQHREELWGFSHLLAQLSRPRIGTSHVRGGWALGVHQHRAKGDLEVQLLLRALRRIRQRLEQLQPPGQMPDRFHIGRALDGAPARPLPMGDGLRYHASLGIVLGQ